MPNIVRAAIVQTEWTGDKDSMIKKNADYAREAAQAGAQVMCFQELFYGPYFCQVQENEFFDYAEPIPDGPDDQADAGPGRKRPGWSWWCPSSRKEQDRLLLQHGAVIDADGTYLGKYRKTHIPHVKGFWEKFYFKPGNTGLPGVRHRSRPHGRLHLLRPHFPGGMACSGLNGAKIVFNPRLRVEGCRCICGILEQPASAVANEYFVGAINRVGQEPFGDNDFYGSSYFVDPAGPDRRRGGFGYRRGAGDPGPRSGHDRGGAPAMGLLS